MLTTLTGWPVMLPHSWPGLRGPCNHPPAEPRTRPSQRRNYKNCPAEHDDDANATVALNGTWASVIATNATVHVAEAADNASVAVTGTGGLIYGGAGFGLVVNTTSGGATQVTLGNGNYSATLQGTGDTITGSAGSEHVVVTGTASVILLIAHI